WVESLERKTGRTESRRLRRAWESPGDSRFPIGDFRAAPIANRKSEIANLEGSCASDRGCVKEGNHRYFFSASMTFLVMSTGVELNFTFPFSATQSYLLSSATFLTAALNFSLALLRSTQYSASSFVSPFSLIFLYSAISLKTSCALISAGFFELSFLP